MKYTTIYIEKSKIIFSFLCEFFDVALSPFDRIRARLDCCLTGVASERKQVEKRAPELYFASFRKFIEGD